MCAGLKTGADFDSVTRDGSERIPGCTNFSFTRQVPEQRVAVEDYSTTTSMHLREPIAGGRRRKNGFEEAASGETVVSRAMKM